MSFDLDALRAAVAAHARVGRIVIVDHAGSAPRETGTSMLVWETGQSGTIGGGALELAAVDALRARLKTGGTEVTRLPLGPALGQCCGGAVTLVNEVYDARVLDALPPEHGLYTRRCEGRAPLPFARSRAAATSRNGSAHQHLIFKDGWLSEPLTAQATPLWIYGAGHVGRALVATLAPLPDFAITWVDSSPDRFPHEIPPGVTALPAANPAASVGLAPKQARHLVLTYSHALDLELCHQLLSHGFLSAGVIGSKTKWARFQKRLAQLGHDARRIAQITCPIGEPALGKHPQAIALGVARALLLAEQARASGGTVRNGAVA